MPHTTVGILVLNRTLQGRFWYSSQSIERNIQAHRDEEQPQGYTTGHGETRLYTQTAFTPVLILILFF